MSDAFRQNFAKLTEIEPGLTAHVMEAEQTLTVRINTLTTRMDDQFERVLNRLAAIEADLHNLRSEHSVTRDLLMQLPETLRRAIEERLHKLEDRAPGP
jgi:hypothetical protein